MLREALVAEFRWHLEYILGYFLALQTQAGKICDKDIKSGVHASKINCDYNRKQAKRQGHP